jgi:uncharacterized metal-binding protein YceD (DUF177 family)
MNTNTWSDTVSLSEISRGPVKRSLQPDEAQRAAVAKLINVDRLDALTADVTAEPWLDGAVVRGRWKGTIEQTCGVSLDPFTTELAGDFEVRVVPQGSPNAPTESTPEIAVDLEAEDPPDVLEGEQVDLAGYVVEHLSLEVDPFPRKPGAQFEPPPEETPASPFAVLKTLNKGDD